MLNITSIPYTHFGQLFLVATPIGNRQDITLRALDVLKSVDEIAAEDTRHTRILLQHYGISKPLFSLHEHNEESRAASIIEKLRAGKNIALVSDAGTPLISDPGFILVQQIRKAGLNVISIPGPCALITALSASGLPCDHFFFAGFLPAQKRSRQKALMVFENTPYTTVFYEAPHRILDLFEDMEKLFGSERQVAFAKELTKVFEKYFLGSIAEAIDWLKSAPEHQKGEFVVMLSGKAAQKTDESLESKTLSVSLESLLKTLLKSLPLKQAAQMASEITGEKKNAVYAMALEIAKVS